MNMILFGTVSAPPTIEWSPLVAIVMVACNIAAIAIGKNTMQNPSAGPALPQSKYFGNMGWPALLATTSFGHVMGFATLFILASWNIV
jgi:photosystem I subunit X